MEERRWEVTVADQDSEDLEKHEITQHEAHVTAITRDDAKQRVLAMIRDRVHDASSHTLVISNVREIWRLGRSRS